MYCRICQNYFPHPSNKARHYRSHQSRITSSTPPVQNSSEPYQPIGTDSPSTYKETNTSVIGRPSARLQLRTQSDSFGFLFSPIDPIYRIWELKNLAIPATVHQELPGFDADNIDAITKLFGDGFGAWEPLPTLHQGVFLMELMQSFYGRKVVYNKFCDLISTIAQHGVHHPLLGSRPMVIFLYQTTDSFNWAHLDRLFLELTVLVKNQDLRTYPCRSEFLWEARKLTDIRVLDDIAHASENPRFQYRPKTCSGYGLCTLAEHSKTVQKRSNSCGSQNVRTIEKRTKRLTCQTAAGSAKGRLPSTGRAVYFHQEFVSSFSLIGEFRVFVVCEKHGSALRGRDARIVHTIRTMWDDDDDIHALNVTKTDSYWKELGSSYAELHEFVLYIVTRLRGRSDWNENYESLEVGVRLDIGIADDGRCFVNEITRWYGADLFSLTTLGSPHTQLCSVYATALHQYFP